MILKIIFNSIIITCLTNLLLLKGEEEFYTLSNNWEKYASLTSFTNNLFLISSSKIYNIINKNYNLINDNKNETYNQNYFLQ